MNLLKNINLKVQVIGNNKKKDTIKFQELALPIKNNHSNEPNGKLALDLRCKNASDNKPPNPNI